MAAALIAAAAALCGCIGGSDEGPLEIKNMELSLEKATKDSVLLNVTTYIENSGGSRSKAISVALRATNSDTGFLASKEDKAVGIIDAHKMINISQPLELPKNGDYRITTSLLEEGVEVSRGSRDVYNLEALPVDRSEAWLNIDRIEFMVRRAANGSVVLENDIYISNIGDNVSPESDLLLKATEMDSNLIADKKWDKIVGIAPGTTAIKGINLTVPDQYNYQVEATIWRAGSQVAEGEDQIILKPGGVKLNQTERIEPKTIDTGQFVVEEAIPAEARAEPGFGALLAIVSISMIIVLRRRMG